MKIKDAVIKNRSYRRFDHTYKISREMVLGYIDTARNVPSPANKQPLKFIVSCDEKNNEIIFSNLFWAGYLKNWDGPEDAERPTAYIVILGDTRIAPKFEVDFGITAQTLLLNAIEDGLGGCIFSNVNRVALKEKLKLPDDLEIVGVIALGKPVEKVVLEVLPEDGDIKYWRDEEKIHHVPKRSLDEVIFSGR